MLPLEIRDAIGGWATDPDVVRTAFAAITVPTLVTHGRRDRLILPAAAEMTAAAIKGATVSFYDDCGHAPFYEDAARYNRELAAFVDESLERARWMTRASFGVARRGSIAPSACFWKQAPPRWSSPRS